MPLNVVRTPEEEIAWGARRPALAKSILTLGRTLLLDRHGHLQEDGSLSTAVRSLRPRGDFDE